VRDCSCHNYITARGLYDARLASLDFVYKWPVDMVRRLPVFCVMNIGASSAVTGCKVCGSPSPLFGVVDFHKSCIEAQGRRLSLSGVPIYYRRCTVCRFVFTDVFDAWPDEAFLTHIYNENYITVDPDFVEVRPSGNARLIAASFEASRSAMSILDYGGGNGRLAELLRAEGFSAETYDPFSSHSQPPESRFDLITCFEVVEHTPSPVRTIAVMSSLLNEGGAILFSTLLQPANFDSVGLNWWYAGPRNGHVSLYSAQALARLFANHEMRVASFSEGLHFAYREVPGFAAHLNLPA
jgi:SAM-dependent methyltransferase